MQAVAAAECSIACFFNEAFQSCYLTVILQSHLACLSLANSVAELSVMSRGGRGGGRGGGASGRGGGMFSAGSSFMGGLSYNDIVNPGKDQADVLYPVSKNS